MKYLSLLWRNDIETISALWAICAANNHWKPVDSQQEISMQSFGAFFIVKSQKSFWTYGWSVGELRRLNVHVTLRHRKALMHLTLRCFLNDISVCIEDTGPWFNKKMSSYQYRKSLCGDKTILRPSYFIHNGISYTGKTTSLYWIGALVFYLQLIISGTDDCNCRLIRAHFTEKIYMVLRQ